MANLNLIDQFGTQIIPCPAIERFSAQDITTKPPMVIDYNLGKKILEADGQAVPQCRIQQLKLHFEGKPRTLIQAIKKEGCHLSIPSLCWLLSNQQLFDQELSHLLVCSDRVIDCTWRYSKCRWYTESHHASSGTYFYGDFVVFFELLEAQVETPT